MVLVLSIGMEEQTLQLRLLGTLLEMEVVLRVHQEGPTARRSRRSTETILAGITYITDTLQTDREVLLCSGLFNHSNI